MKIIKTASGKYKLTKQAWEEIGKKTGWTEEESKIYRDNDKILEISGHPVLDPNLKYTSTIKDESGSVESVLTDATLSEIYLWAKEHNFNIREEQKRIAQITSPKMMPGQKPYSKEEYKKLTEMVGEAAEGDPGEIGEASVLEETQIDGVPFTISDGVKVVNIIHLLIKIGGDMQSYEENSARVLEWAKKHNAHYYARTRDKFSIPGAIQEAKENNKNIVIVEDLS